MIRKASAAGIMVMLCCGACLAADAAKKDGTVSAEPQKEEASVVTGQVAAIVFGDTFAGTKPKIGIVADKGEKMSFVITPQTKIVNELVQVIRLGDIPKDSYVTVEYIIKPGGVNAAVLIQVL